ncbi:MAG: N-acetylmuramoyl-L-alanine amidase [Clostridia bacterium]|nr:N-acetylmuramoyl-L-alanine amidase [Clostridia bacterium]
MKFTNSPLVTYTNITSHKTCPREKPIDTITIHCMVSQWTAKQCCDYFANTRRECSSNYAVGRDGSIGLSVDEKDRSWCSSNAENDNRAITIEVASDKEAPYAVTDAAYDALISLVADVCKRNNVKKLVWSSEKEDRVNHRNGCNMTVHRDFSNKFCPGEYLYERQGEIAERVNKILSAGEACEKR